MTTQAPNGLIWIYPNTSELNRRFRGGFSEREDYRLQAGFDLVEMPGDFVKNETESDHLGLRLCEPLLAREQVSEIYRCDPVRSVRYSLHTEPSIPRTASYQMRAQAELRWNDPKWVNLFATHVFGIVDFLQTIPEIVELHPGYQPNTIRDVAEGIARFVGLWQGRYETTPRFLLENRTDQVVARGAEFARFWDAVQASPAQVSDHMGIIVDFQQLHTRAKQSFWADLEQIPIVAVWEYHVHAKHSVPSLTDPIDWEAAFGLVRRSLALRPVYMLPEVHHHKGVDPTAAFIRGTLERTPMGEVREKEIGE